MTTPRQPDYQSTKHHILELLGNSQNPNYSQNQIKNFVGLKSQSAVSEHLKDLEEAGLIERKKRDDLPNIKELTREGYQFLQEAPTQNEPIGPESENSDGSVFVHKLFFSFQISNQEDLDSGWRERWVQGLPVRKRYMPDAGAYTYFRDDWKFRVTENRVIVHLAEKRGKSPRHLKNKALVEAFEAVRWLEENAPVECVKEPVESEVWVNQAEAGVIAHPFALLVERYSSLSLEDVRVYSEDGKERIRLDSSHGPELEFTHEEFSEEDCKAEVDRLEHQSKNPDRHRWIYEDMPEKVEELEKRVEELEEKASNPTEKYPELNFSSTWMDQWGNIMGYCVDLEKAIKVMDSEKLPA